MGHGLTWYKEDVMLSGDDFAAICMQVISAQPENEWVIGSEEYDAVANIVQAIQDADEEEE